MFRVQGLGFRVWVEGLGVTAHSSEGGSRAWRRVEG